MPLSIYKNIGETTGEFSQRIKKMIGCKKSYITDHNYYDKENCNYNPLEPTKYVR